MLQVNELAVISPEWRTTGSLSLLENLPTEVATGSRPKKINFIEANLYYFVNIADFCWTVRLFPSFLLLLFLPAVSLNPW